MAALDSSGEPQIKNSALPGAAPETIDVPPFSIGIYSYAIE
jgi:hypothetical protein